MLGIHPLFLAWTHPLRLLGDLLVTRKPMGRHIQYIFTYLSQAVGYPSPTMGCSTHTVGATVSCKLVWDQTSMGTWKPHVCIIFSLGSKGFHFSGLHSSLDAHTIFPFVDTLLCQISNWAVNCFQLTEPWQVPCLAFLPLNLIRNCVYIASEKVESLPV